MPNPSVRLGLSVLEFPIAIGLGFAAFMGTFTAGCALMHCVDAGGMLFLLLGMLVGPIVGIGYWITMMRKAPRLAVRLSVDAIVLTIALGAYLVPVILSKRATARSVAASAEFLGARKERRAEWIDSLKANAHGVPGEVPPMLTVADEGADAVVTNRSGRVVIVALARVLPDPTAPGGWRACPMHTSVHRAFRTSVGTRQPERFQLAANCARMFTGAPIEYRVGDNPPDEGWWSDSAIATPDWPSPGGPDRAMPVYVQPKAPPQRNPGVEPNARSYGDTISAGAPESRPAAPGSNRR